LEVSSVLINIIDMDTTLRSLYPVDIGSVADVSEVKFEVGGVP
jgi:hypothetical protein